MFIEKKKWWKKTAKQNLYKEWVEKDGELQETACSCGTELQRIDRVLITYNLHLDDNKRAVVPTSSLCIQQK